MARFSLGLLLTAVPKLVLAASQGNATGLVSGSDIPVYVMLPLDLVRSEGAVKDPQGLRQDLIRIRDTGTTGVMLDVWWGIVERTPQEYRWTPYLELAALVRELGLRMQVIMSFHTCGGNVGDSCNISLPAWLPPEQEWGYRDSLGQVDTDYISLFNDAKVLGDTGRTPLQMYEDYMVSFAITFHDHLSGDDGRVATISTVEIGMGPAGELRYPSYNMKFWKYPGIGEFQCFDSSARQLLAAAAVAAGQPDWGNPPDNAGHYNDLPHQTEFFQSQGMHSFDSEYGQFFLSWYSNALVEHGRSVLTRARKAFANITGVHIDGKVAGVHWHFRHPSHAAELTAGYYNSGPNSSQNAYLDIAQMLKEVDAGFCFTCLEMRDVEQSSVEVAASQPEALVLQTKEAALKAGVYFSGENALERYDRQAYATIAEKARVVMDLKSFTYLRLGAALLQPSALREFALFRQVLGAEAPFEMLAAVAEAQVNTGEAADIVPAAPPRRAAAATGFLV